MKAKIQGTIICPECGFVMLGDGGQFVLDESIRCVNKDCSLKQKRFELPEVELVPKSVGELSRERYFKELEEKYIKMENKSSLP